MLTTTTNRPDLPLKPKEFPGQLCNQFEAKHMGHNDSRRQEETAVYAAENDQIIVAHYLYSDNFRHVRRDFF